MARRKKLRVLKRSEKLEVLSEEKIADSIFLAAQDVGGTDYQLSQELAKKVIKKLGQHFGRLGQVSSAEIGDMVEKVLLEEGHYKTVKAYILNREKKRQDEARKRALGVNDDIGLSYSALLVAKEKYLLKGEDGEPRESISDIFKRSAKLMAQVERKAERKHWYKKFFEVMKERKFLPGGRTLANAGTANNQLANCFVMPMPDDVEGIFDSLKKSSILKKYGGGVGFNFGHIRPKGDQVSTTSGSACGPIALMQLINDASDIYLQAGKRRSGNMVVLPVSHPDIMEFIHCKDGGNRFQHINYSIALTRKFLRAVKKNGDWPLINPRNGEVVRTISARSIFEEAARMAWKNGDPGVIFIDRINEDNPTPHIEPIESVNLCGEQPLLNYEACNLGSINLGKFVKVEKHTWKGKRIDWDDLKETVAVAVRFLDNVVDVCDYPLKEVKERVRGNRKIGLGIMGWADMLVRLGIPYNSDKALRLARKVMKFIQQSGWEASELLGKERGSFPNFEGSLWEKRGFKHFRNATVTTIAPTGSISILADCSSGIEPHFALAYRRKSLDGLELLEVNKDLIKAIKYENGLYNDELLSEISLKGKIGGIERIPKEIRKIFVTAMEISPEMHVEMLAAFQRYTDNAVSKTINLPAEATVEDVMNIFMKAGELKCKGLTVYRDGSRDGQVLNVGIKKTQNYSAKLKSFINKSKGNKCPNCGGKLVVEEGCKKCYSCGYSVCG